MESNELKKILYKDKPTADFVHVRKDGLLYQARYVSGVIDNRSVYAYVNFMIPLSELGESTFLRDMPAQLLIRYIIDEPKY